MNLLLDANLSWRLTQTLSEHFPGTAHVDKIGLTVPPKDIEIWNYAKEHNYIIVTNDEDFIDLMTFKGFPPKVILLRTGNQNTKFIADLPIKHSVNIRDLIESRDLGLLEIFAS